MILGAILNQDKMLFRLCQHVQQEGRIALGIETASLSLPKEATGDVVNQAKDFVGLALAAGLDHGLLPLERPGVTQGAPLSEARFVTEQNHGTLLFGDAQKLRPGLPQPVDARRFVQMVGDKTSFLERKAHVVQQAADVLWVVLHTKVTEDQVLNDDCCPATRGIASCFWAGNDQVSQLLSLCFCQLGRATSGLLVAQAVNALQNEGADVITAGL